MCDVKYYYFDIGARGEPARLLLAYGGIEWEDNRVALPWLEPGPWAELKPKLDYLQVPMMNWKGKELYQSMAICRFLAGEFGLLGKDRWEAAKIDEMIGMVQDSVDATYKAWYDYKEYQTASLTKLVDEVYPNMLNLIEKQLEKRGGKFLVGDNFTWADIHLFGFCSEEFIDKQALEKTPLIADLVARVGQIPNIKKWVENRPEKKQEVPERRIYNSNPYKILGRA